MKYYQAIVLVGFPDKEVFDSSGDLTFALGAKLHEPSKNMWLISHSEKLDRSQFKSLKESIFTPEGGI